MLLINPSWVSLLPFNFVIISAVSIEMAIVVGAFLDSASSHFAQQKK